MRTYLAILAWNAYDDGSFLSHAIMRQLRLQRWRMGQVITANRLHDGVVVFRAADGAWVETIGAAEHLGSAEATQVALAAGARAEAENLVLDAYAIDVAVKAGALVPARLREAIRASGPTVHPEHGKPGTRPT